MTFVPQPFEQIADDLLTALTGGVTREEHRFVGAEETYALASPDAITASVKVTGVRQGAFAAFDRDIDYSVDTTEGAIRWRAGPDARPPDAQTFFHVNYYRAEGVRRLTDRNPGSVNATLAYAFAREVAVLQQQMDAIYWSPFVDHATGTSLDHTAALLALVRKDARFAGGTVLFRRATPAPGDITIAAGTVVSTELGDAFETTDKRTLRRGQLSVSAPVRAQTQGPAGRVAAGAVTIVNRPIFGVESVVNEEPTFFATAKETDDEFRRRIRGTLERAGKSTVEAIRVSLIEQVPGVDETNVQVAERADVPGLVEVKLGLGAEVTEDIVRRVDEAIFAARPAGVRVTHNLRVGGGAGGAGGSVAGTMATGAPKVPARRLDPDDLARFPDGVLELQVAVALQLADPSLSAVEKERVEEALRERVVAWVDALPMGGDIVYSKLLARAVDADEVLDATLAVGAFGAGAPAYRENLATDGRKARVAPDAVDVSLMAEPVLFDLLVLTAPNGTPPAPVHQDLARQALDAVLAETVAGRADGAAVTKADVQGALTRALAAATPPLTLAASRAVVLNAEYADTGRVLVDTDAVALAPHHAPARRTLRLEPAEVD